MGAQIEERQKQPLSSADTQDGSTITCREEGTGLTQQDKAPWQPPDTHCSRVKRKGEGDRPTDGSGFAGCCNTQGPGGLGEGCRRTVKEARSCGVVNTKVV